VWGLDRMTRADYWNQQIAFDCPITKKRHTLNDCFHRCQENGFEYLESNKRVEAFLYCCLDSQERFLHDGKVRRDL
jgi:hypothetical protein